MTAVVPSGKRPGTQASRVKHPTKAMPLPDGRAAIDVKIAPLIGQCWRLGLRTRYSCQGDATTEPRRTQAAYISFESALDALLFVGLAARGASRTFGYELAGGGWWLEGAVVRFPPGDIRRATSALRRVRTGVADLIAESRAPRTCGCGRRLGPDDRTDATVCASRQCRNSGVTRPLSET